MFLGSKKKFSEVKGVTSTEVGYSQGKNSKTSYEEVCTGTTDHVEVVLVEFEEDQVSYENLVHLFYDLHDPTTSINKGQIEVPNIALFQDTMMKAKK